MRSILVLGFIALILEIWRYFKILRSNGIWITYVAYVKNEISFTDNLVEKLKS